jgi:hypothetical protein
MGKSSFRDKKVETSIEVDTYGTVQDSIGFLEIYKPHMNIM